MSEICLNNSAGGKCVFSECCYLFCAMDLLLWYYQKWFINSAQLLRPGRLVLSSHSDSQGINFSCCGSVTASWTLSRKSFYFASTVLLFLTLLPFPWPTQGLPGKDGETGPAGPPGPAVRTLISRIALQLSVDINVVSPISIHYPHSTAWSWWKSLQKKKNPSCNLNTEVMCKHPLFNCWTTLRDLVLFFCLFLNVANWVKPWFLPQYFHVCLL